MIVQTPSRSAATAFENELEYRIAVMEHKAANPAADYSIRRYPDGFYVYVIGGGWLSSRANYS